jgi:proteasome assembly chaperone (PAC2) family protein
MAQNNCFYDGGNGLILFRGDEPWYRIDLYGEAFFQAITELGIEQAVAVEGYNGPAPPEIERRIGCVYSKAEMKETLERYGVQFSNYGSSGRQGPTIGMALVALAHYLYPNLQVFRLGAMAPMFPFNTPDNQQAGIATDHRSFYDIMRRLRAMFQLDINLSELESLGVAESRRLQETLELIGAGNAEAKRYIDRVRSDYSYARYEEQVDLTPGLDQTLRDILENIPDEQ